MAVRAAPVEVLDGAEGLRLGGMAAAVVAGVADARHTDLQELGIVRAMGFMAIRTVFQHRRVLPEKGASALSVATQTVLVDRALNQLAGIGRAMWIMAACAGNLAFAIGHVRRPL